MAENESRLDQLLRERAAIDDLLRRHQTAFSVLFTDVVGSTSYFEKYGDIAGMAMLTRHEDVARKAISNRGGRVIKNIGDSVMVEFNEPLAAARAAVDIQRALIRVNNTLPERERIQLRIGINHGTGFRHEGDVYGDVVNVAARITKHTGPAQILVSASVEQAVSGSGELRCNYVSKIEMKGKAEEGAVYEIVWTDTSTYVDLRRNVTVALKRGDLMAPGLDVNKLAQTSPPTPPPAPPAPAGEWTGTMAVPASLESRYEMMGELGSGGMGVVYKARDRETNDLVAIKMLRPEIAANEKGMLRFKNELRIARRITHKNVCRIHEFNRTENTAYITMEFVEGESLRHLLGRFGSLSLQKGIDIARQICAGLREAHAQGVVHRDLKPENVMLDPAGGVKVMDFGIAHAPTAAGGVQLTQTQAVVGTPTYMSPEQAEGKPLDHRSDIYALGLILYEIFTGTQTFTADNPITIVVKHIQEKPVPPRQLDASIPEPLEAAILKCLEKSPDNRFQSVDELSFALATALSPGASALGRTGEVIAPAGLPVPEAAYYSPTPYATQPPAPLPTPPPAPRAAAPAAVQATTVVSPTERPMAPVAAPAPPPPQPSSSAMKTGMLIGAILATGLLALFALYKIFFGPKPPEQAQAPAEQAAPANPATAALPPAAQPGPAEGGSSTPPPSSAPPASAQPAPSGATGSTPAPSKASSGAPPSVEPAPAPAAPVRVSVSFAQGNTLAGHTAAVSAVAFSADSRYVVTGSADRSVRVWEAGTGRVVATLKGHKDTVTAVAFSPNGRFVASGSRDKTVLLWALGSDQPSATLKETSFINAVAFSPDGQLLAYSNADGRIKVLDASSGEGVAALDGHSGPVFSIEFSPDGRRLVSGGRDQTARIWNVSSGAELRQLKGHSEAVNTVAFSPDGRWVATASDDKTVKLWDASTGREVRTFTGHTGAADGLVFGPEGRWLAAGSEDKIVLVWDTATGDELTKLEGHIYSITDLAITRNGRWLASAAGDKVVRLWRRE